MDPASPGFIPPADRIATFDNDGTLWTEHPVYTQLAHLRQNGFRTFIVSGAGVEFMRPWTEAVYGIPRENVVGSTIRTAYEVVDAEPVIVRRPELDFINDKAGKPVGIHRFIGRRPVAAFGNSAGDRQMLEWTTAGDGPRLAMLVFHDDAQREYAYGPARGLEDTHVGAFPEALMQEADANGWVVISMRDDWKRVFPLDD